jgi:ATPase subunit of ABC transporter with duplicated ATPase domains
VTGTVDHLRQDVTRSSRTVADLLGVGDVRAAIRAIEQGSLDQAHFDTIGDDWDVDERAVAQLASLGLPTDLDRSATRLSGGEAMLTALAGVRLRGRDVALLDEPTNNLDVESRERLYDVVRTWRGTLVVVSHDLDLLDLLDATVELRGSTLTSYGGPWSEFRAWTEAQQESARQALRTAEQTLRRERRERAKAEERIAHSERQGRKDRANRKYVAAVVDDRRNSAEKAQGARRGAADAKVEAAREAVASAELGVRDDDTIRVDLPDPQVPRSRRVLELPSRDGRTQVLQGPERVALTGSNGVGKSTLLAQVLPAATVRVGLLPQRIVLDDDATVLDLVADAAPGVPTADLRNRLARLLVRGAMVDRPVGTLSGGERFRVALARLVLADPPPELLVLDEPTNDLDIASVDQLVTALAAYRGALLVVSHDRRFLERLDLDRVLRLEADGVLSEVSTRP